MMTEIKPYENIKFHACRQIESKDDDNKYDCKFFCDTDETEMIPHESKKIQYIDMPIDTENVKSFMFGHPALIGAIAPALSNSDMPMPNKKPIIIKEKHQNNYFDDKEIITYNGVNIMTRARYEDRIKTIDEGIDKFNNFNIHDLNLAIKNTALFNVYNFDDIDIESLSPIEVMNNPEIYKDDLELFDEIKLVVDSYINIVFKDISYYKNDDCPYEMMHAKAEISFTY